MDFADSLVSVATDLALKTIFAILINYNSEMEEECWTCKVIDMEEAFLETEVDRTI